MLTSGDVKKLNDAELKQQQQVVIRAMDAVSFLNEHGYFDEENNVAYQRIQAQLSYENVVLKTEQESRTVTGKSQQPTVSDSVAKTMDNTQSADVYVDGSFNPNTGEYGYGVLIIQGDSKRSLSGSGIARHGGRNVEGEVAAAQRAITYAKMHGIKEMTIYHDYEGIGKWGDQQWKRNKSYTQEYAKNVAIARTSMDIKFVHVDGHTGVEGNELVDTLAKEACGMSVTNKAHERLSEIESVEDTFGDYE